MTPPTTATAPPPEAAIDAPVPAMLREKPVFAAESDTRPRVLKLAGRAAAGLVGLWLVALVLGALGFGHVAGLQLPRIGGDDHNSRSDAAQKADAHRDAPAPGVTISARPNARVASAGHAGPAQAPGGGSARGGSRTNASPGSSPSAPHAGGSTPGGGGSSVVAAPATGSAPATATPTATTTPAPSSTTPGSTHSQATPPGSSSTAPGTRSQATTAPGRDQSTAQPAPGSGRTEHAPPPKG